MASGPVERLLALSEPQTRKYCFSEPSEVAGVTMEFRLTYRGKLDGRLYRLAQDCVPTYGYQVRAFQITDLSPKTYAEQLVETPVVKASSKGWNAEAMHHVDAHEIGKGKWIAAVDALGR